MADDIEAMKTCYEAARSARDDAYWHFTRRANVSPVHMVELSKIAADARRAWMAAARQNPQPLASDTPPNTTP